ncbi:MAG TPA: Uma2 family endonuclease [Allocoleopsis sp.]
MRGIIMIITQTPAITTSGKIDITQIPDHTKLPISDGTGFAEENLILPLPDHTQLPDSDGTFVKNFQEHPQSILLTDSIRDTLDQIHPDGQYAIGQDCGIYWRVTDPPQKGAESPDWFYVPNVPPLLDGNVRRSYVLWYEHIAPLIVLEFVSGDGTEERDKTPITGKFWVYEKAIRVPYYGIFEMPKLSLEMYYLDRNNYRQMLPNERGNYPIEQLNVELGIWQGSYQNMNIPWLRWWDNQGNLLLTGHEQSQLSNLRLIQETERANIEAQRARKLAEKLRDLGINPDEL